MAVATHDYFNIDGAWTTFREASRIYGKLGHGERVALFEFEDKHGFSKPRREAAMRWLRRWLVGKDDAPSEKDVAIFTDAELLCTRSGQVLEDFKGKSAFHLNIERARELAKDRRAPSAADVRKAIGLPSEKIRARATPVASSPAKQDGIEHAEFKLLSEPGIELTIGRFVPEKGNGRTIVFVNGGSWRTEAGPDGAIGRLLKDGCTVIAADLRGMGELAPTKQTAKPSYFGGDFKEAFLALHLNRPLLGQRAHDLLCVVDQYATDKNKMEVIAVGSAGPIALHAAALDSRIAKLTLEKSLISWQNVVETPINYNQLTNVVPGALRLYDLPVLAAMIAPRPLTIRDAVDAKGQPAARDELISSYRACRERYGQLNAGKDFVLQPSAK
jgi:pimeloyl-ACP methyl ester carboxylesterase